MTVNTTWVSPVSATLDKTTGNTIDETMTDALASNFYHLGGATGYIAARVYNNANISVPDATLTTLTFNAESFDSDPNGEIHSTSANTNRLTCRTAGLYHITAQVRWAASAAGYRQVGIYLDSATPLALSTRTANGAGAATDQTVSTSVILAATQWVDVIVLQTSGGALNAESFGIAAPVLQMVKA